MTTTPPTPTLIPLDTKLGLYELHVDNSAKELFETCSRAAEYYTVKRRESAGERAALFYGGVVHQALVPRKLNQPNWEQLQEQLVIKAFSDHPPALDEWRTAERCLDTLRFYNKTYPLDAEPFKLVPDTVELGFKLPIGVAELDSDVTTHAGTFHVNKVVLMWTGRLDAIVSYDGQLLIMDHKTTSILGPTFYDDFVIGSQMLGYTWAARKLGFDVKGLLLDVIGARKPTKSGVGNELQRQRYFYSQEHIDEWEHDTFTAITDFLEHLCRGYFKKSTKWCFGRYGRCQYWDVCTQIPTQREAMLQSDMYKNVTWSPLNPQ